MTDRPHQPGPAGQAPLNADVDPPAAPLEAPDAPPHGAPGRARRLGARLDALGAWLTERLGDLLDAAGDRRRTAVLLVLLVALAAALPGLTSLPVTDRDEARFVQASRQMVETGDPVDIRFQDEPRWKKPAGIYWVQSLSVLGAQAAMGEDAKNAIWPYRIPSVLGAAGAALGLLWAATPLIGRRGAALAGMILGTAVIVAAEATIAKVDAALLALSVLSMGAYARLLALSRAGRGAVAAEDMRPMSLLFWGLLGLGALLKGPIILLPPFGAALALAARESSLRPLRAMGWGWGPLLALAIALPWYVAIAIRTEGAFFEEALLKDLLGKVVEGKESHGAPPGTYLAVFWGIFWPWAPLLLACAPGVWAMRRRGAGPFLLAWAIPTWLAFELTPTKLPHYVMPALPPVAILLAMALEEAWRAPPAPRWRRWIPAILSGAVGMALALALVFGPAVIQLSNDGPLDPMAALVAAALGIVGGALSLSAARALARGDAWGATAPSLAAALVLFVGVLGWGLPALRHGFPSVAMAEAAGPVISCTGRAPGALSYREPSLVFLQGRDTPMWTEAEAAAALAARDGATVWAEDRLRAPLDEALAAEGVTVREISSVAAFNPNRGKETVLRLLGAEDDPELTVCPR